MWDICRRFHWLLVSDSIISMIITYSWLSVIIYLLQLRCPFLSDQLPGFASLPVSWLFSCPFAPLTSDSCHSHTDWSSSTHFAPRSFPPVFKSSFNFLSAAVMHLMTALHRQINIPVKLEDNNVKRDAPHLNNEMNSYQSKMQIISFDLLFTSKYLQPSDRYRYIYFIFLHFTLSTHQYLPLEPLWWEHIHQKELIVIIKISHCNIVRPHHYNAEDGQVSYQAHFTITNNLFYNATPKSRVKLCSNKGNKIRPVSATAPRLRVTNHLWMKTNMNSQYWVNNQLKKIHTGAQTTTKTKQEVRNYNQPGQCRHMKTLNIGKMTE